MIKHGSYNRLLFSTALGSVFENLLDHSSKPQQILIFEWSCCQLDMAWGSCYFVRFVCPLFSMALVDLSTIGEVPYTQVYISRCGQIPHRPLNSHCQMAAHRLGTASTLTWIQLPGKTRKENSRLRGSKVRYKVRARKCHEERRSFDALVRGPDPADSRQTLDACVPQSSVCERSGRKAHVAVALSVGPRDQS